MPRLTVPMLALWVASASTSLADGPDPRLAGYRVAPGFRAAIAATEPMVVNPVTMTWAPDGRLFVVEWKEGREPNDHIKALSDTDGDGVFDKAEMYMDKLDLPAGVTFWDGWTYVTLDHDVVRFHDPDLDGKFDRREVVASGFGNDNSHHRVSGLIIGPDGWLYMTTGDSDCHAKGSDGSTGTILRSGGVLRCKPDGSKLEVVAFGMRNPWGNVAFDDEFHIFHTDNDNEGAVGFTGCRLLHVVEGGDYGWRLREGARCCQPDYERATWNGGRPGRLGWMAETGRGAPAGLCVLNSAAFPPSTRNLLVYPDVFRKSVRAYTLKPEGATFKADKEFELLASDEGLFRPTDAEIGPDGALYILDWRTDSGGAGKLSGNGTTGRIYRITWGGTEKEPARKTLDREKTLAVGREKIELLQDAVESASDPLLKSVGLELIRRRPKDIAPLVPVLVNPEAKVSARIWALTIIVAINPMDIAAARRVARDLNPTLRRLGFEYFGRFTPNSGDAGGVGTIWYGLENEANPEVIRAGAVALGRFTKAFQAIGFEGRYQPVTPSDLANRLLDIAVREAASEAFLRDGITRGLDRLGAAGIEALVKAIRSDDARKQAAAVFALQGCRSPEAMAAILDLIDPPQKSAALPAGSAPEFFRTLREFGPAVPPARIVAYLKAHADSDPTARMWAIRVLTAMPAKASPEVAPILAGLLRSGDADVRKAALDLAAVSRSDDAKLALLDLVKDPEKPSGERKSALTALRGYEDRSLAPTLEKLFGTSRDAAFYSELLRVLASMDFDSASRFAETALASPDSILRGEAISVLGQKAPTALRVANLYNEGKLPAEDLARVIEAVRLHATPELQAAMQLLLKNKLLASPTGEEAKKLREFVAKNGNPGRGKSIYLDAKKGNCATCHRIETTGGSVGPDLTRVWQTLSFDKRVESILEPSKEIKEGYNTYKVATKDGRVSVGLLVSNSADAVVLKDAQGREVRIPAAEIEEKGNDPTSLMPAGVVGHLSFAELADLLAFLGDKDSQDQLKK